MSHIEARIRRDYSDWARNTARLDIRDGSAFLRSDGTWETVEEGEVIGDQFGIVLPAGAIEAIAVAVQEFQGHTSHADTETRVLREWLAVERARVDRALIPTPE